MKAQAQRMIGALVLTLATAAVLVGAAQAEHPNDRAGVLGVGGVAATQAAVVPDWIERAVAARALMDNTQAAVAPDWIERAVARAQADRVVLPNDRAGMLGVGGIASSSQPVVPDWIERAALRAATDVRPDDRGGLRGPGMVPTEAPAVTTASGDGFRWGDAAFGAAGALGLVLLGMLAALTIRHRSRVILR